MSRNFHFEIPIQARTRVEQSANPNFMPEFESKGFSQRHEGPNSASGWRSFSRGALYELLSNPIYIGETRR